MFHCFDEQSFRLKYCELVIIIITIVVVIFILFRKQITRNVRHFSISFSSFSFSFSFFFFKYICTLPICNTVTRLPKT